MSSLTCGFCTHPNPDASKFCNECGSPTHLVPCPSCEAINNRSDRRCCRCSALLWPAAEEDAAVPVDAPIAEAADTAQSAAGISSTPVALADRMEDFPWAPGSNGAQAAAASVAEREREPALQADADVEEYAAAEPHAHDVPVRLEPYDRARYDAHRSARTRVILLGIVFAAIAGAVYWSGVVPTQTSESRAPESAPAAATPAAATPATATPAAATPAAAAPATAAAAPAPAAAAPAAPPPATAESSADAAKSAPPEPRESANDAPPRAEMPPPEPETAPTPPLVAPAGKTDAVQAASPADTKAAATKPHDNDEARRRAAQRRREQAERDALATQRLIARQLGDTARAAPDAPPP